ADFFEQLACSRLGNSLAAEADPLAEMIQMRRGVQAGAQTRRAQRGLGKRAGRPLPVRAGDVQDRRAPLRIAEQSAGFLHSLEPELDPEVAAREQERFQLFEGHRGLEPSCTSCTSRTGASPKISKYFCARSSSVGAAIRSHSQSAA